MSAIPVIQRDMGLASCEPSPAELLLRDVPLPVTILPAQPLSDQDLLAFCAANKGLEIESDADGSITIMTPAGPESSRLNQLLTAELTLWSRQAGGIVFGPDLGIRFPDKTMRGPDAAWLSAERWNGLSPREREIFLTFCPEFVAELRSASDRASASEAKMEFWMTRGAAIGWLIDPRRKLAMIYHPGREPETLLQPEFLDGDGPISGFRLEMRQFWKSRSASMEKPNGVRSPQWSEWRFFPDPREHGLLIAPFGPGCYELRDGNQAVLYGTSKNVAYRMTSLLPKEWGCGTRNGREKRQYVFAHLGRIQYRTLARATETEAQEEERKLKSRKSDYLFPN